MVSVLAGIDYLRWALEQIDIGRAKAGRTDKHALATFAMFAVDNDGAAAKNRLRGIMGFYLAAMARSSLTEVYGIADELVELAKGGPEAVAAGLEDAWIDDLVVAGDPDECAERIRALLGAGSDSGPALPGPGRGGDLRDRDRGPRRAPPASRDEGGRKMTYSIVAGIPTRAGSASACSRTTSASAASSPGRRRESAPSRRSRSQSRPYGPLGLDLMRDGATRPGGARGARAPRRGGGEVRQVAMIDAAGNAAAHTGGRCVAAAGDVQRGPLSAQGNMMVVPACWTSMPDAYASAAGSFAERLLAALDAAEAAGGDVRGRQSAALLVVGGERSGRSPGKASASTSASTTTPIRSPSSAASSATARPTTRSATRSSRAAR